MESNRLERPIGRRELLGAVGAAGLLLIKPQQVRGQAANAGVRLGLIGCGGRGANVSSSFVKYTGTRVTALADLFPDQLEKAKSQLDEVNKEFGHGPVERSQMFHGPRAYEQLCGSSEVDVVYIATPIYFHPQHFEAAVASGKHVYLEKPVSVDVPGAKRVLAAARKANGKQSLTVGLQLRYVTPYVELMKRIHGGALGEVVTGQVHYYAGPLQRPERPQASPLELRVRNWIWNRKLSGDIIVEQNVHVIDLTNWALQAHPLSAWGAAGRKGREGRGDNSSHYNCVFNYPNDVHISFTSTQFIKDSWDVGLQYFGTKATAEANYERPVRISGDAPWEFPGLGETAPADAAAAQTGVFQGAVANADEMKLRHFIETITTGNYTVEIDYGVESTLTAIMARMAAEKGQVVTWDEMMRSAEIWDPQVDLGKLG